MKIINLASIIILSYSAAHAQFSKAIEDNSFFIEEAYNQEDGVVQHIFTGTGGSGEQFNELSFTQEWPLFSQTHQISYTIPYLASNNLSGFGDIMLNYRYQLMNENGLAVSPRFSLILPSGDKKNELGSDVFGMQMNFPLSKRWNNEFITHFNAGFTFLPNVRPGVSVNTTDIQNKEMDVTTYFTGASGIFLATPKSNIMLEALYSSTNGSEEFILSPGVRYAIDIDDLQIVPGLAIPFTIIPSGRGKNRIFLYISFEHPV